MYIVQPFINEDLIFSFYLSTQFLYRPSSTNYTKHVWRRNPPYWTLQLLLLHTQRRLVFCSGEGSHVVADAFPPRRTGDVEPGLRATLQSCRFLAIILPIARLRLPPAWGRPWPLLRFAKSLWHPHASAMPLFKSLPLLRLMPGSV